ncbi:MAG: hypothetical protein JSU00_04625 [Acidobacteria bacterium]|nr:hypothetical protein [Acidobacteriota bacterium]
MPERIYKLQPNRTIQLRGFNDLGAAAALHSATATGFEVSGIFRDPADFCVLTLYDCDNFYEHPTLRYLPDMNFDGVTLDFDVHYTGLRNLDSPRYPIIDWPQLDMILADGTRTNIQLLDRNNPTPNFASGTWTAASAQFTIVDGGFTQWDHVTLWFLNRAFDFMVGQLQATYAFTSQGAGAVHSITVGGVVYPYTELAGDTNTAIAQQVGQAAAASPLVTVQWAANQVTLTAKRGDGHAFQVSATSNPTAQTLYATSAASIAADLASQCNATVWADVGADIPITAVADGATITFTAAKKGLDGNALSIYAVSKNNQLTTDKGSAQFAGGASDATWHVHIDFAAHNARRIRQMWLTFAPPISVGAPFQATEWRAQFSNWTVGGPEATRMLQVAGPGSYRLEDAATACVYAGKWDVEAGFYSRGYAKVATQQGSTLTIRYASALAHDLWVGTSLYSDRGSANVTIDGVALSSPFDTYLDTRDDPAVVTRRKLAGGLSAGSHVVTFETRDAKPFYFDFLEVAVPSDVPDNLPARTNISPALDYSTDHTYKLPPSRILWMFDKLGFAGPMNEYIGVFWWNQRTRTGAVIPQATLAFSGTFAQNDQVWLTIAGTRIGKSVFATDTPATIARHFAAYINATFVGLWAMADGNQLLLTSHSPTKDFQFDLLTEIDPPTSAGSVTVSGTLKYPANQIQTGKWMVDTTQTPALNRGARDWHADFFAECKSRNRPLTVATSMELVLPPDPLPARYLNGDPVKTDVGYGSDWWSSQCAFNSAMLSYQKQVYDCIAGLQAAAGLAVELQFGEFCWWYFKSKVDGSMAFYDADTKAAAQTALGRPLATFSSPTDSPQINGGADATFLRNRLRDHVAALSTYIAGKYPGAVFEVLFPYDVNYPNQAGVNSLGGQLLRYVNFPTEWSSKATSGLARLKMEGLDWGAATRDLNLVRDVMEFPIQLGWPLDSIRYMMPIFNGGCPWIAEYRLAADLKIPYINLWAFDHVCIFGLNVKQPARPARAMRF